MKKKNSIPFAITIKIIYFFCLIGLGTWIWLWSIPIERGENASLWRASLPATVTIASNSLTSTMDAPGTMDARSEASPILEADAHSSQTKSVTTTNEPVISQSLGSPSLTKERDPPANPNASAATRQLLAWFQRPDHACQVIAGQDIQMLDAAQDRYTNLVEELHKETGRWVGLLGADYNSWGDNKDWSYTNRILIDYWREGGLVEVHWSASNPWTGGDAWDREVRDLRQLLRKGTAVHEEWMAQLSHVADGLDRLQQAGVVVLWRPFTALNAGWFWWGSHNHPDDPKPMQALWQQMFDYFTKERGLHNLLWVYTIAYKNPWDADVQAIDFYYPGERFVDIVGQVIYDPTLDHLMYEELSTFGKPVALTEFGISSQSEPLSDGSYDYLSMLNQIKNQYPQLLYWLSSVDWTDDGKPVNNSIRSNRNALALMNHDCVVTRDEIHWQAIQNR